VNAEAAIPVAAPTPMAADERPYVIRTYDRWIILIVVLVGGWFLFRPIIAYSVYYRGVSYEHLLRLHTAEHYYAKSTRVYTKIPQGWQAWGELYLMRAPSEKSAQQTAVDVFVKGISYNPRFAPLAFDLGRAYFIGKDYANARAAFERSAHYAPDDMFSWDFAAWASLKSGNLTLARKYWHEVLRIDPGNATAARQLATLGS
jgi:tetratricopeptide (TPR) repeat protein